jgi:hypothetical protein
MPSCRRHRRIPVSNLNSGIMSTCCAWDSPVTDSLNGEKHWGEILSGRRVIQRQIKLKVNGMNRRFDMQRVLLSAIFQVWARGERVRPHRGFDGTSSMGGDYGANSVEDDVWAGGRRMDHHGKVSKYPLCWYPSRCDLAPGFMQCTSGVKAVATVAIYRYIIVSKEK